MFDLIFNIYNVLVVVLGFAATFWCFKRYKVTKSRPLLNCLPGVFTSLGLLGTFCSICWSLHGLGGTVSTEIVDNTGKTLAEVKAAAGNDIDIIKIISELIPAFTSSIVGLLCALGITIYTKMVFANEEAEDDAKLAGKSPEEYIRDIAIYAKETADHKEYLQQNNAHLQEQTNLLQKHNEQLQENKDLLKEQNSKLQELIDLQKAQEEKNREYNDTLNTNISKQSQILKEFIDGFVNRMDDIFKQMHGAIQQQVQNFGEEQFTKTSELLTSITERLSTVSNSIISQQRNSVEEMMANTNNEISNITKSVTEVLGKLTEEVQSSLTSLNSQQSERLNSIISNYDTLAAKLTEQNSEFTAKVNEQLQSEFEKVQRHNVESLEQMVDLKDAYQETTSQVLANTLEMNEKATTNLRESMSGFVNNIQDSISTQCNALSTAISTNVKSLNDAYKFIETLVAEIRQNYDQSVLAYGDAVNVAHRTNETAEKTIQATNKSLSSVEATNNKISEVLDILTTRQDNIEQLTKQICYISSTIVELQKLENMLNKIANGK